MPLGDTTALLQSIRRHTGIPDTHPSFTDTYVLADATEELHSYLLPLGLAQGQELWAGPTGRVRLPVESGVAAYTIPSRAVGAKLRAARLLDSQGNPVHLNYYGREEVARQRDSGDMPHGLVLEGGTLRLFPTPRNLAGYVLEVDFYVRPAELVTTPYAAYVATTPTPTTYTVVQVVRTPENAGLLAVGQLVDVVAGTPPFDTRVLEALVIDADDVGSGRWNLILDTTAEVFPGDWVCPAGQSPVVQAPLEWHPLLALKVASRQASSLGDYDAARQKGGEGGQKERQAATLVRPRREDVTRKVRNGMDKWRGGGWGY